MTECCPSSRQSRQFRRQFMMAQNPHCRRCGMPVQQNDANNGDFACVVAGELLCIECEHDVAIGGAQ